MSIENDRWFKLKLDNWILANGNVAAGFTRRSYRDYHKTSKRKWYEMDYMWDQVGEALARGTKYTPEEVTEYLKERQACAKLEALLDDK